MKSENRKRPGQELEEESSEEIQKAISRTRGRMDQTFNELGEKLHSGRIVEEASHVFEPGERASRVRETLIKPVRTYPLSSLLVGTGLLWYSLKRQAGQTRRPPQAAAIPERPHPAGAGPRSESGVHELMAGGAKFLAFGLIAGALSRNRSEDQPYSGARAFRSRLAQNPATANVEVFEPAATKASPGEEHAIRSSGLEPQRTNQRRTPEESQRDPSGEERGSQAEKPRQIPKRGWKEIFSRVWSNFTSHHLSMLAAGVAFFLAVALVPTLAAAISIYALVADPAQVQEQFAGMAGILPEDLRGLLQDQMTRIAGQTGAAGAAAIVSILLALWSGSAGVKGLMEALNIIYREEDKRSFIKRSLTALGLTLAAIILGMVSIFLIAIFPIIVNFVGLGGLPEGLTSALRWPLLFVAALFVLAVYYRYAPDRDEPQWKWVSWGAVVATVLWVAGSGLFSLYVSQFGNYNETYGSLGAAVLLLLWLYLSSFAVLLGAEINAEMEHQTEKDTTKGKPQPLGERGAHVADNAVA
jgi:membrane protein